MQKYGNLTKFIFCRFLQQTWQFQQEKDMVKAARSRQICEVVTRDSLDQQFLSRDLSKHVVENMLDKDFRSRQRITTRSDTGAKNLLLRQKTICRDREKA